MKFYKLLFLFISQIVIAQGGLNDLSFQYLTINNGLSQNTVLAIVQDSSGYIWFGTRDGLNRYDGYKFKQYYTDILDTNSLTSNEISAMDVAPNGVIWIGTNYGLNSFNPKSGEFKRYFHDPSNINSIADNSINVITHNSKGEIFIGTENGLSIITNNKKIETYCIDGEEELKENQIISSIVVDEEENIWIGGLHYFSKYNRRLNKFEKIDLIPEKELEKKPIVVQGLVFDNSDELWIATGYGLIKYNIKTEKIIRNIYPKVRFDPLVREYLRNIYKDSNGNIWFAEWSGLRIFDKSSDEFISYTKSKEKGLLNSSAINAILEDKSGVIWIGTSFGGVNYFDPTKKKFNTLNQTTGLSNNIISSIAEDDSGNIWIGTIGGGINKLDKNNNVVEVITAENSKLKNNLIRIIKISGNDLWVGDWGNNLTNYSLSTGEMKITNLADLGYSIHPSNTIKDIEVDNNDNLWIATSRNGVFKFPANGEVEIYSQKSSNGLVSNKVQEIFFDRNNGMWIITEKGLSQYSEDKNTFEYLDFKEKSIANANIFSIFVDDENTFWCGTNGSGLLKINVTKKEFINYRATENIPNNVVYGILPDVTGNLWLSTNNGLAKFNPETEMSTHFNVDDGLQSNEFNDNAFLRTSDGKLIFGGIEGLNIISSNEINKNEYIPPIVITNVYFLNSLANEEDYFRIIDSTIILKYNETDITIEFAALNYSQPNKNKYAYKLEPSNENWINLENRRTITFTNLNHGEYRLKIKGSNNDGVWNEKGIELNIVVLPPFWLSWWFSTFVVLFIVGIISLIIYLKMRALIKVERLRTKIASDLHDDVGASLTKISMNASLLNYETEPSGIQKRVKSLNRLSQEVISMMSDIVWSIDARNDTMQDLIDRMKNITFNLVDEKDIDVNFISDCTINNQKLKINIRQNIYLIFKEAFHNAVKYSNSKKIDISITASKHGFKFVLVDYGIGLKSKNNKHNNGLRNMKMRAERINGEFSLINENGLTVLFTIKKL